MNKTTRQLLEQAKQKPRRPVQIKSRLESLNEQERHDEVIRTVKCVIRTHSKAIKRLADM